MRLICTILFISLCFYLKSQQSSFPLLNKKDSTFTFSYIQSVNLGKTLERSSILEKELLLIKDAFNTQELVIRKLQLRDTLMQIEIKDSKNIETELRKQLSLSNNIESNYKKLVFSAEEQLKAEQKEKKEQEIWKNIYKYGYPILIGIVTVLVLN